MTRVWRLRSPSPDILSFADRTGVTPAEAQILLNRGISDEEALHSFLLPRLSSLLDPMILKDMKEAVSVVVKALEQRDPITIYGDFDADGLTATAVLMNFLTGLNASVFCHIPNRLTEGYGLHAQAVDSIARHRGGLLITVDCGISNGEEIALARELGMQVVVTDHHQVPEGFTPPCPVVNPHRPDCPFPFKELSGVGLAFFLCVALRARLREGGWFRNRMEPDLRQHLDLVALGTIADMVPLLDQNRILVHSGLERMRDSSWPGMKALREVAVPGSGATLSSDDLAFRLAPRLNASGRLGDAETGIRTLTTASHAEARELARKLNELNGRRQALERAILNQIEEAMVGRFDLQNQRTLVLAGKGWHKGVLGIVASRLAERYHRPAIVLDVEDGVAAGSGRSIPGFDLYGALARLKPLLRRFGGHRHAAGLSLQSARIEAFAEELEAIA
ncbi:MAG: single-stranded-DNA-specific exonuclease RecJ, partial [Deltaproteobacteria bacterium]|nr:single-stranded-DNA-specific exonuclease RecJ [Deltaproteobacteria bacterium]